MVDEFSGIIFHAVSAPKDDLLVVELKLSELYSV